MSRHWMRMINSAQRVITLNQQRVFRSQGLEELKLDIQGITLKRSGRESFVPYLEMASYGIHKGWAKPLSIWQRIKRQQTPLGWLESEGDDRVKISLWWDFPIELTFDLELEEDAIGFRETEIMVMSGGYCFSPKARS